MITAPIRNVRTYQKSQIKCVHSAGHSLPKAPSIRRQRFQAIKGFQFSPPFPGGAHRAIRARQDEGSASKSKFYVDDLERALAVRAKIRLVFADTHRNSPSCPEPDTLNPIIGQLPFGRWPLPRTDEEGGRQYSGLAGSRLFGNQKRHSAPDVGS